MWIVCMYVVILQCYCQDCQTKTTQQINQSILATVNNNGVVIVDDQQTIQMDENGL